MLKPGAADQFGRRSRKRNSGMIDCCKDPNIFSGCYSQAPTEDWGWKRLISWRLKGYMSSLAPTVVAVTQAMLPLIRKSGESRIVNVSSGLGSVGWHEFKSEFGGAGLGKDGQADFKAQFFIDCGSDWAVFELK